MSLFYYRFQEAKQSFSWPVIRLAPPSLFLLGLLCLAGLVAFHPLSVRPESTCHYSGLYVFPPCMSQKACGLGRGSEQCCFGVFQIVMVVGRMAHRISVGGRVLLRGQNHHSRLAVMAVERLILRTCSGWVIKVRQRDNWGSD